MPNRAEEGGAKQGTGGGKKSVPAARSGGKNTAFSAPGREYLKSALREKDYFDFDAGFLPMMLSGKIDSVAEDDILPLSKAVDMVDKIMTRGGLKPLGDIEFIVNEDEFAARLYSGSPGIFGFILAGSPYFELFLCAPLEDGRWLVTGAGEFPDSWALDSRDDLEFESAEGGIALMLAGHGKRVKREKILDGVAPATLEDGARMLHRLLAGA